MRIALVHMRHAAIGGTEQILDQLSRRLAERGHEVWILCRSHVAASHPSVRFVVLKSAVVGSAWRRWPFPAAPPGIPGIPRGYFVEATKR